MSKLNLGYLELRTLYGTSNMMFDEFRDLGNVQLLFALLCV